jgi:hypothetical protein
MATADSGCCPPIIRQTDPKSAIRQVYHAKIYSDVYPLSGCLTGSHPIKVRSPTVKKGRHRRFEEARKLKQSGPSASDLGLGGRSKEAQTEEDQYAAIAEKYGVRFDEDDEESDEEEN